MTPRERDSRGTVQSGAGFPRAVLAPSNQRRAYSDCRRFTDTAAAATSRLLVRRNEGVTMSIGIGSLKLNQPGGADQLVSCAYAALYQAKEAGRNRISVSGGSSRTAARMR